VKKGDPLLGRKTRRRRGGEREVLFAAGELVSLRRYSWNCERDKFTGVRHRDVR